GVSHTDAESPECVWHVKNPLASSTKRMSLGGQWDTIDDHFGDNNWHKNITL
ncbi:hypothetical protein GYMLUDRAFT_105150, partial [Collybiopsis luxurians FD-317 M1]